ncbi:hypothetical protein [Sandarakinorhabdus sp.]|uniref:hypothetical protein n=1 Tax=Sandarakinorhabdus sp. TaxID=1916663 RepID=UPI00286D9DCD|nr:hypothetical protein [Sandarakinorhabdus sp.]
MLPITGFVQGSRVDRFKRDEANFRAAAADDFRRDTLLRELERAKFAGGGRTAPADPATRPSAEPEGGPATLATDSPAARPGADLGADFTRVTGVAMVDLAINPVRPGDLITAAYMNGLVDGMLSLHRRLVAVEDFLEGQDGGDTNDEPEDTETGIKLSRAIFALTDDGSAIGVFYGENLDKVPTYAVAASRLGTAKRKDVQTVGDATGRAFLFSAERGMIGDIGGALKTDGPVLLAMKGNNPLASRTMVAAQDETRAILLRALKAKDPAKALQALAM